MKLNLLLESFCLVATGTGDHDYIAPGGSDATGHLDLMVDMGQGCGDVSRTPVDFGYDGISCCVLTLTRDELDKV